MKALLLALLTWTALLTCAACSSSPSTSDGQDSQTNENIGSTSLAYSTAYQVTWSGNATIPTGCPASCSGGTCICGTQTSACIGGPGWGDRNFTDTSPPNAVITSVHLDIQEIGCAAGTVTAFLNGVRIGAYQPTATCACNACDPPQAVQSQRYERGFPSYNYGGVNTLSLVASSGSPCLAKVDIRVDGTTARLGITPATYTFGSQRVGTTSAAQTFSVQNQGTEDLSVTSFGTTGSFAIQSAPGTPFVLAAGQAAAVAIAFAPTASGPASGSLTVTSTDARPPVVVPLAGTGVAPAVAASPNPKDFGPLPIGSNVNGIVTITNTGNDTLSVSDIAVRGPEASEFTLVAPPIAPRIPAGQSVPLTVRFAPSGHGFRSAEIVIVSDAANEPTLRSALGGIGQGPAMEVAPLSVDFGGANVNTNAAPRAVEVRNVGETPLRIASASFSNGDFGTQAAFPLDVAPGGRAELALTFRPSAVGQRTARVTLTSNDPLRPTAEIELAGEGTSPTVSVTPPSVDFGDVRVGSPPLAKSVTIANTGTGPLVITRAVVNGPNAAQFPLSPVTLPLTIAPGQESTLTVTYGPTAVGASTATLSLDSNDPASATVAVPLAGKGVSSVIALQPSMLDFGAQLVSRTSAARTAEITNTGTASLNITALTLGGAQLDMFAIANAPDLPATVAPGAKLALSLTFKPTAIGAAAGELAIVSDDPTMPRAVLTLKGSAVSQLLSVTPTSLDFGVLKVGAKAAAKPVTITNTGGDPIALTDGVLEGAGASSFEVTRLTGSLDPGKTATVNVTYTARAAGDAVATLKLGATDTAIPKAQIALRGRGVSSLLVADATALDFGRINVGEKAQPKEITLKNQSSGALEIGSIAIDNEQFAVDGSVAQLAAGASGKFTVVYQPTKPGDAKGTVHVILKGASADEVTVPVSGNAVGPAKDDPNKDDPDGSSGSGGSSIYGGGCGCRSAGDAPAGGAPAAFSVAVGLALLGLLRRLHPRGGRASLPRSAPRARSPRRRSRRA
ncbi:choice-of-anchor D domain-containing protein [Pendulispora albinea]|uniref:Choice-of-anchor D domain-containing protein n=1 Tax=Pendulispora albinea TaxID=2741071 RepID=A0ABZ2LYJ6_9BACT